MSLSSVSARRKLASLPSALSTLSLSSAKSNAGMNMKNMCTRRNGLRRTARSTGRPPRRLNVQNMITGASQADVALIMVPCDGNFTTASAKGIHKAGEIQGQTRQYSRLINLLGVKQIVIGCNEMDCDTAGYSSVATMCPSSTSDLLSYVGLRDPPFFQ